MCGDPGIFFRYSRSIHASCSNIDGILVVTVVDAWTPVLELVRSVSLHNAVS